jgi:hypothetical protein
MDIDLSSHNKEASLVSFNKAGEGHGQCRPVMKTSPSLGPTAAQNTSINFFFHF